MCRVIHLQAVQLRSGEPCHTLPRFGKKNKAGLTSNRPLPGLSPAALLPGPATPPLLLLEARPSPQRLRASHPGPLGDLSQQVRARRPPAPTCLMTLVDFAAPGSMGRTCPRLGLRLHPDLAAWPCHSLPPCLSRRGSARPWRRQEAAPGVLPWMRSSGPKPSTCLSSPAP